MDNAYFYYKTTMAYYQARPGLSYPVLSFQESVGSINVAYVITANVNKKHTVDQTAINSTTSESSDDVQTPKSSRIKWNYGQTSPLIHFWKKNIDNIVFCFE